MIPFQNLLLVFSLLFTSYGDNNPLEEALVVSDEVEVHVADKLENSLVLAVPDGGKEAYILDKKGGKLFEWAFDAQISRDLELLPDGKLLGIFQVDHPYFSFNGYGGLIRIINADGSVDWEFAYNSQGYLAHHDVEMLPNGNVIFIAWDEIKIEQAHAMGINATYHIYPESLIEVDPATNQIVWEWHSIDHMVQDTDPDLPNYGQINMNPQLINHNYHITDEKGGDIMHANGIGYDTFNDVIYLSVNEYSEVWVIDHSTTIAEVSSHSGGNYGKGGDLIYRFGNPEVYNNQNGTRLFDKVHFPNMLEGNEPGAGNLLVYVNGPTNKQSTVYELKMPAAFNLVADADNEPEVVWSFTDPDLFYQRISGAVRLDNGNTLICEGDYGFWEVTPENEVVWKFNGTGEQKYWRVYDYQPDDSAIVNLGI
jgi:hypothetical protein